VMMPSSGGRCPMAPACSRARRRGKSGPGKPEAHQEQDGGVVEARRGRIRANRRRPVCGTASSMASIGRFPSCLAGRGVRGRRGGSPRLHGHDDLSRYGMAADRR
jgi:hypothetical protein